MTNESWSSCLPGDVDREVERESAVAPDRGLRARGAQHPPADVDDHPGLLEQGDEEVGIDDAANRVLPAQQRLDAGDRAGLERADRLVDEEELVAIERGAQVELELPVIEHGRVHLGREHDVAVLAGRLRLVQRDVGVAQQLARCAAVADRDADARGHRDRGAGELERLAQHLEQTFGDELGRGTVGVALGEHDELVAAEPADRLAAAEHGFEPGRRPRAAAGRRRRGRACR